MKKIIYCLISIIVTSSFSIAAPIRNTDSTELLKFYTATGSGAWKTTTNWRTDKPVSTWYGITTEVKDINGVPTEVVSRIELRANQLEGDVPGSLNLPDLKVLDLSFNNLAGSVPKYFMTKLITLDLSSNQLDKNGIPDLVKYYPALENLILFNNNVFDGTFSNQTISTLKQINIGGNMLSGSLPLLNLPNLEVLEISKNQFDGEIPKMVLPKLKVLNISRNYFTGSMPALNLPAIEDFIIASNQISGAFSSANLTNAKNIDINNNQFNGTLNDISMTNLLSFIAYYNEFNGKTPNINCPNLTTLDLGQNQFTSISNSIVAPKLANLSLNNNFLTDITNLTNLTSLVSLILAENQLASIPSLTKLNKLTALSLKGNRIKSLPALSTTVNNLAIQNNRFTFDAIELLAPIAAQFKNFSYAPQDTILPLIRTVVDTNYTLKVVTGGSNLTYKWFQKGKAITGATSSTYTTSIKKTGEIYCEVGHKVLTQLTLVSESKDPASVPYSEEEFENLFQFESFPNPTANLISIKLKAEMSLNLSFELFDSNGNLVINYGTNQVSNNFVKNLDLSELTSGAYFLKISNNNRYYTSKIIKY